MSGQNNRVEDFREELVKAGIDAAIVLSKENICYLTGFCVGSHERLTALVVDRNSSSLVVPKLSLGQIRDLPVDKSLTWDDRQDPYEMTEKLMEGGSGMTTFATERGMPLSRYVRFRQNIGAEPVFVDGILEEMRGRKRKDEIEKMSRAVEISEKALKKTIPEIRPGITEKEIAGILEYNMRRFGSDGSAFGTTVATGKNSANPHHITSESKVESGDSLVIDFGAAYASYTSDQTRTFVVEKIPDGYKDVYNAVKDAQEAGVAFAKPGIPAGDIDDHVRSIIEKRGYGEYFTHRTGHGIGLEVHEAPYINSSNREPLNPPVTFTVEPGIYILGKYGVRIEDTVLLEQSGAKPLNKFNRELTVI